MKFIEEEVKKEEKIEVGDLVKNESDELRIIVEVSNDMFIAISLFGDNISGEPTEIEDLVDLCGYTLVAKAKDLELRIKK